MQSRTCRQSRNCRIGAEDLTAQPARPRKHYQELHQIDRQTQRDRQTDLQTEREREREREREGETAAVDLLKPSSNRNELSFGLIQGFTCSLQRAQQLLTILKLPFVHLQNLFFQLLTRSHRFIYNEPGSNISEVLHSSLPSKIRSCLLGKLALCNQKELRSETAQDSPPPPLFASINVRYDMSFTSLQRFKPYWGGVFSAI